MQNGEHTITNKKGIHGIIEIKTSKYDQQQILLRFDHQQAEHLADQIKALLETKGFTINTRPNNTQLKNRQRYH